MNTRLSGCLLLFGLVPYLSPAETVILKPLADTTLHQKFPTNNVGGHFDVAAGGVASGEHTRALIRFDLAGRIPSSATVTSVTLTVR
ncbi:MAG: hypothetical protein L0Z50_01475, partial [Verrucomicrobiales bacterium]|nr:hypothetical protein [Verrucomicrobiales bacterium]